MSEAVTTAREGRIAVISLNRPDTLNALSADVVEGLVAAMKAVDADDGVSCVVLTGAGRAFSSGGNLKEIKALTAEQGMDAIAVERWYRDGIQKIPMTMNALSVPVVAAVNGHAIGAGCDLATMCDIRIAGEDAQFAESFLKVGIIPGDGGAWFLPRVVGQARAMEMLLTGRRIKAPEAAEWGLVSRVVPNANLMAEAMKMAEAVAAQPPVALRAAKRLFRATQNMGLADSLAAAAAAQGMLQQMGDHHEAIDAILEKRAPVFKGV
ncbi:MAG: enoyl-CoA hydratase-related protein [Pseudomonadota bacterium]